MSEWRPIESAPKDGTRILVYGDGDMAVAFWSRDDEDPSDEPYWAMDDGHDYFRGLRRGLMFPTHWMPLPEPPK